MISTYFLLRIVLLQYLPRVTPFGQAAQGIQEGHYYFPQG